MKEFPDVTMRKLTSTYADIDQLETLNSRPRDAQRGSHVIDIVLPAVSATPFQQVVVFHKYTQQYIEFSKYPDVERIVWGQMKCYLKRNKKSSFKYFLKIYAFSIFILSIITSERHRSMGNNKSLTMSVP